MRSLLAKLLLTAALLAPATGCIGSPQEEPEVSLDTYPFDLRLIDVELADPLVHLTGRDGAASGVAEIWGVSLDAPAALAIALVDSRGGFELDVPAAASDRLRLHAATALGIEPVDLLIDGDALVLPGDCAIALSITEYRDFGGVVVGETDSATIELQNLCEGSIVIAGTAALAGTGAFALELEPGTLASGATALATARFTPTVTGEVFDYLAVEIDGHAPYVLTVRGRGE